VKLLIGMGGSGMLLGGLYAGDALTPGQIYDKPFAQAYSELAAMPVPVELVTAMSGSDSTTVDVHCTPDAIGWHFMISGHEVSVFTARLNAHDASRTRVRVSYAPGADISPEIERLTSTALARSLAEIVMSDQVEAELEDRPLDRGATLHKLARHVSDHPEQVRQYGQEVGNIIKDFGNQAALAASASGNSTVRTDPRQAMDAATRPSVILPAN